MNESYVEDVPLPLIYTTKSDVIVSFDMDQLPPTFPLLQTGCALGECFDSFESSGEFYLATYKKKAYLLLPNPVSLEGRTEVVYLIAPGGQYVQLLEKVRELDTYNRELDAIIESSYDGFYITDHEGKTLNVNSAIERITGIPKEYYVGKNINDLLQRGILKESVTHKVLDKKERVTLVQKNYSGKETLLTGSPVFDGKGEVEKVVTNIRDLSELNDLHEEINKVQKLNDQYKHELERMKAYQHHDPDVVLRSDRMQEVFAVAERLANVDATVLILGETGVGKDVFAKHLYRISNRFDTGKLIKVDCGAIPKDLLESELFGYERGAFSGASLSGKPGMFELANNGFLFLDEIGELTLPLQVKLLRALQEKEIQRIGGTTTRVVNVRVIAATNQNLKQMVQDGTFREDLYYRLNVVPISIPPLRERRDDILPLVQHYLNQALEKYNLSKWFARELKEFFYQYNWPGNVRELSNLIERLILTVPTDKIELLDLPEEYRMNSVTAEVKSKQRYTLKEAVAEAEKAVLIEALETCKTTYELAEHLNTSQATVVRKLKKYKLQPSAIQY
ncbi:sigma-54 interaction domain-containing protein [Salsuginibacillus kocurii]|uniref:sigma-54 interaction domain-containing protein n=1 Tax=Salsuginibacillus kocurii TaxID=427078 RepID=UPI00035F22F5|nr:sigma 54-interacting transcriptional regulator [Salsuginibacillus kocurii]